MSRGPSRVDVYTTTTCPAASAAMRCSRDTPGAGLDTLDTRLAASNVIPALVDRAAKISVPCRVSCHVMYTRCSAPTVTAAICGATDPYDASMPMSSMFTWAENVTPLSVDRVNRMSELAVDGRSSCHVT